MSSGSITGRRGRSRALPRGAQIAAIVFLACCLGGALVLLLAGDGWAVNRANVWVWARVTGPLGLQGIVGPEQFAVLANVALFVPIFAALALLVPSWWWIAIAGVGSIAVEAYQFTLGTRQAEIVDVITNIAGAALGVTVGILLRGRLVRAVSEVGGSGAPRGTSGANEPTIPGGVPAVSEDAPGGVPDGRD